ncbi:pantoate--beta-alanine ligase [Gracilibacillus halotolerans]|uniref:Pantothenate synthetase n=1 Tax=Gracilibacillus halotolerans TaxID=74386 RepID=A0A841RLM4_9BACI|nr:pantoate--beta-alanine ligase [Gracilibacillus halotolerans]MBB6511628.1 pantoate--beta-alanine ligase [Gracilibacillus halotolerans]
MKVIRTVKEMSSVTDEFKKRGQTIGFVPTMGYLHEGHTALIDYAKQQCDIVITSIFVNPLQFGPNEDFDQYPRDEERDTELAEKHRVDILFMPSVDEMYPDDTIAKVSIEKRTNCLCGKSRPGHFDGVATVLMKLFHITKADYAYFGLKDAQQFAIVKGFVKDFNLPVHVVGIPTVREKDGLAKSSRNVYLNTNERAEATHLYQSLILAQQFIIDGNQNTDMIREKVTKYLEEHTSGKIDYVDILSYPKLEPITTFDNQFIIAIAVYFNGARLIDNIILDPSGKMIEVIS